MKRHRRLQNAIDDQIAPIWFVVGFHTMIHLVGIFTMVQFPYSWRMGVESQAITAPFFRLVVWVSVLSLIWAFLRFGAFRLPRVSILVLLIIPVILSAGTIAYAYTVTKCATVGRSMLQSEVKHLNERIERFKDKPRRIRWDIQERDRLLEELK